MLNVIKMDLYRMFKSKITWIILIIIGILAVTTMFTKHREYEYFVNRAIESMVEEGYTQEQAEEELADSAENPMYLPSYEFDIFNFYPQLIQSSAIGMFLAIFAVIFAGTENSTGFIKNIAGQSSIRHRTMLSKCLSIFVFTCMILILYFAIAVVCSQLLFGYISFGLYSISDMIVFTLTQLLLNVALGIVVMCISELIRNPAVSMAIGVLLSVGISRLLTGYLDNLFKIEKFSFTSLLITPYISSAPLPFDSGIYRQAWIVGTVFLVSAVSLSILSMKKRDIK